MGMGSLPFPHLMLVLCLLGSKLNVLLFSVIVVVGDGGWYFIFGGIGRLCSLAGWRGSLWRWDESKAQVYPWGIVIFICCPADMRRLTCPGNSKQEGRVLEGYYINIDHGNVLVLPLEAGNPQLKTFSSKTPTPVVVVIKLGPAFAGGSFRQGSVGRHG